MQQLRRIRLALFLLLLALGTTAVAPQKKPKKKAPVLVSSDTGIYADALTGLTSTLDPSVEAPVTYLDSLEEDAGGLSRYFSDNSDADFFITIGSRATRLALAESKDKRVIFSMVNSPRAFGLANRPDACGVSMDVSLSEFFVTLKQISPKAKNVYAFYTTEEGEFAAQEGDYLDFRNGVEFRRQKLASKDDFARALESIKGKADAYYLVPDALYDSEQFQILSDFCKKNKVILMTSFTSLMQAGATFSIRPDYGRIGSLTADMANRVLGGRDCGERRVVFPDQSFFSLNEAYANESGIEVPATIRERASRTRLFLAGVNLMNEGKLKSARIVFDSILARDPANASAAFYKSAIVERMSGTQTRHILDVARRDHDQKNYERALAGYRQVLEINPNNPEAREGMRATLLLVSEQSRIRGDSATNPYDAARQYMAAIKYSPENGKATQGLERIRAQQKPQIPVYLQEGIGDYDQREYDRAIQTFENILLIDPANKQAQEYLRISIKKRDALRKLQAR